MQRFKFAITSLALMTAYTAGAAELTCSGKILQINLHAPDTYMLQLDSMNTPVFFCKPNATWTVPGTSYSTSAETCRTLIGVFLAAKVSEKSLAVIYFDGSDVPASCNAWGAWTSANIRFFTWAD